jgi:hypothetical protein
MENWKKYEEYRSISPFWSWVILVLCSITILAWGMLIMFTVRDVPRRWDFGQLPDTPAESVHSTQVYRAERFPRVMPMLPGADLKLAPAYKKELSKNKGMERAGEN